MGEGEQVAGVELGLEEGKKMKGRKKRVGVGEKKRVERKRRFLQRFLVVGSICRAGEGVGVTVRTVGRWLKTDEAFAEGFEVVREAYAERLEEEADRRGAWGMMYFRFYRDKAIDDPRTGKPLIESKYSDKLLMFRLRGLKPGMYGGRVKEEKKEVVMVKVYRGVDVERV
jgi:hypothetical protein